MWDSHIIIHLCQGINNTPLVIFEWIIDQYGAVRDFTITCITKKLEAKMPAYTSFISDVHKSYGVEK